MAEVAHPDRVVAQFPNISRRRHRIAARKLLFHALWHRRHILALPPTGGVFETLAAE